ncbi:hypothetical protein CLOSTMETH_03823 [[Clostridium] methylpentosum DSM 5476]|uniref:Uncharacterized protein n=1 Tax=[Clostridium] methylpentosum DSM 5476 TaxID=537013 RepID=C0EIX7_9FIRM|nr:hypothetical protein CLOSTMETH_03823 [[Clostridium] methylpentosum DSM 5476]
MVLPYKIAPWRSYFPTSGDFLSMSVFLGFVQTAVGGFLMLKSAILDDSSTLNHCITKYFQQSPKPHEIPPD